MSRPAPPRPSTTVRVRVPATSANLGPGFDACGLALGLHDELTVTVTGPGLSIEVTGEDDGVRDETHLVVRALRAGFAAAGTAPAGIRLTCVNRIPHGRGLGSSAAAIVAGLLAASALGEGCPSIPEVFALACGIEGHPDNVAAALYGGFTVAWYGTDGPPRVARTDPPDDLRPVVFVPARRQLTAQSRVALPAGVSHADAAMNAGRAALLAMVMSGTLRARPDGACACACATASPGLRVPENHDGAAFGPVGEYQCCDNRNDYAQPVNNRPAGNQHVRPGAVSWQDALLAAADDRLHQPYRLPSMPETRDLLARLRAAGLAAVLSGSGPTVLALAVDRDQAAVARECAGSDFSVLDLPVDRDGAQVEV
ncbi:homoserine kinase, partial [Candidatus Protofrankia californiensis]|uniref:homoserine kinase n=1 Tax=Candidatus Protofrankia californiensis TaxID=1839754 RepID=UPI001F49601C